MIEVRRAVEEFYVTDRLDGGDDLVDNFRASRFGKIGDAFDELGHGILDLRFWVLDLRLAKV